MNKDQADVLALRIVAEALSIDLNTFSENKNTGVATANNLADFVQTLSTRLQSDIGKTTLADHVIGGEDQE